MRFLNHQKKKKKKPIKYDALCLRWSNEQVTIVQRVQLYTHSQRARRQKSHILLGNSEQRKKIYNHQLIAYMYGTYA